MEQDYEQQNIDDLLIEAKKHEHSNPALSIQYAQAGLDKAIIDTNKVYEAKFLKVLAYCYFHSGTSRLALQYYQEAINICTEYFPDETTFLVELMSGIAAVYKFRKEYTVASDFYYKALKYDIEHLNDKIYDNIASLYFIQKNYKKALQYLHKGLGIAEKYNNHRMTNSIFANIGVIHYAKGEKHKAIEYFEEGFKVSETHQYTRISSYTLMNIGDTYTSMGEYEKGLPYYFKAEPFIKQNTYIHDEALWNRKLGYSFYLQKDNETALQYYKTAWKIAKDNDLEGNLPLDILEEIQKLYQEQEDYKEAYQYQRLLVELQKKTIEKEQSKELKVTLDEKEEEILILKDKNKKIKQQNSILKQFSHIVAHDLKAPLRNISGFTSLLNRRYARHFDERAQEYMTYIKDNVKQMNEMLTDLLKFVTLENREESLEEVDLNEILLQVQSNLRIAMGMYEVVLKTVNLPTIYGYKFYITQLFQNLIQNAIKFRREEPPVITIKVEKLLDRYRFSVEDNGIGIEESQRRRVFRIFKRLHKNNDKYEGTGIGLALCEKIVEMHEGRIWVESELGKGSTFFFTLVDLKKE